MNTIRKVIIVVPVLITSCQVFENSKTGPVTAHIITIRAASINAAGLPADRVTTEDILSKTLEIPLVLAVVFMHSKICIQ
jgi:hypothetical protein